MLSEAEKTRWTTEEQVILLEAKISNVRALRAILPEYIANMIDNALEGY